MTTTLNAHLTVEEANQRLPLLQRITADLVRAWGEISEKRGELEELRAQSWIEPIAIEAQRDLEAHLAKLVQRVNACVSEIEGLGGEVEEFRRGIIRFEGELGGRTVYLSWLPGERSFSHYYEKHESHLRRRAIA